MIEYLTKQRRVSTCARNRSTGQAPCSAPASVLGEVFKAIMPGRMDPTLEKRIYSQDGIEAGSRLRRSRTRRQLSGQLRAHGLPRSLPARAHAVLSQRHLGSRVKHAKGNAAAFPGCVFLLPRPRQRGAPPDRKLGRVKDPGIHVPGDPGLGTAPGTGHRPETGRPLSPVAVNARRTWGRPLSCLAAKHRSCDHH